MTAEMIRAESVGIFTSLRHWMAGKLFCRKFASRLRRHVLRILEMQVPHRDGRREAITADWSRRVTASFMCSGQIAARGFTNCGLLKCVQAKVGTNKVVAITPPPTSDLGRNNLREGTIDIPDRSAAIRKLTRN